MPTTITLPYDWSPRPYQQKLWDFLVNGGKRAVVSWCRRSGKDEVSLRYLSRAVFERPGTYWHLMPLAVQVRRALWRGINPHTGRRRLNEIFPKEIVAKELDQEMLLEFRNGSTLQFLGSDNYDALVGSPPVGIVWSEAALCDQTSWAYIRPILAENDGFSIWISTPRGRNHFWTLFNEARNDPNWFAESLPAWETGIFTPEQLEREKIELVREYGFEQGTALYDQEFGVSFQAALLGSIYGSEMTTAERDGRITSVPHNPSLPTYTAVDLGFADQTCIWFLQLVGKEIHAIDYIEASGQALPYYVQEITKRHYTYASHLLPHDASVRELGTGKSRLETLRSLGLNNCRVIPAQSLQDGLNAVRQSLPMMWFDRVKCARGIECLQRYRRRYNEKRQVYEDHPFHDQYSHGADALRTFCTANIRTVASRPVRHRSQAFV